jgi:hypothetical protein
MSALAPWYRPAGVELTRILPWEEAAAIPKKIKRDAERLYANADEFEKQYYIDLRWKDKVANARLWKQGGILEQGRKLRDQHSQLIHVFGTDPYCVEVSSTILKDWKSLKKFFTLIDTFCAKEGLLRFSDEICGTGGHIHIGVSGAEEACYIKRLMLNHPEAMFAFCNPCDDSHNLENLTKDQMLNHLKYQEIYGDTLYTTVDIRGQKAYPIAYRTDHDTVEFRMFDVAQTWEMQEEHMAFAQAFVEYALKHPLKNTKKLLYQNQVKARSVQDHCNNFMALIEQLNLPTKRYKWYIGNIKTRFEFGTENFS